MDKATIIEVLKKWNPWEKSINAGIKRQKYIEKIYPYLKRKEVVVLKGIRRAGKSTIVKQLMLELIKNGVNRKPSTVTPEPIIYISPNVFSETKMLKKLELEYIGSTRCSVYIKPITAMVYMTWLFGKNEWRNMQVL